MTLSNAKVILSGKNSVDAFPKAHFHTEEWFKTKYCLIKKNIAALKKLIAGYDRSKLGLP